MYRYRLVGILALLPALAAFVVLSGCGGSDKGDKPSAEKVSSDTSKITPAGKKEELASTGWGTLKGKVTFDGTPPVMKPDIVQSDNKDKEFCHKGSPKDIQEQTWKIGPDKGVANVVVFLKAPDGKYFKIPEDEKERKDTVKIDQPFCAFEPHVVALFPSYFDGATQKQKPTGQKFEIVNSAPITHNTNWRSSDSTLIKGDNVILPSKGAPRVIQVKASSDKKTGDHQQVAISCDIHKWMSGYALVFDNPFTAVTSGDAKDQKDFGAFEIKKVPTGAEVEIWYWHESMPKAQMLKKVTLKDGTNTEDFKIK
jgi:hypothetical protein